MRLICAIVVTAFLPMTYVKASTPVPQVYRDYSFRLLGQQFSLLETDRVVVGEFQKELAPGRQVSCHFGPFVIVVPLAFSEMMVGLCLVVGLLVIASLVRKRKRANVQAAHSMPHGRRRIK